MSNIETYTFGNNDIYQFERYAIEAGVVSQDIGLLGRTTIEQDAYYTALKNINDTHQTIKDPQTGKQFEIAIANQGSANKTVDAEISTFTSSISASIGHAIEFAEHTASQPDRARVYIASLGSGGSSYWDAAERKYIRKTGKFTTPEGDALPTVVALERALAVAGLAISRLSTNSAGGAYATSLMRALPEGQVTHAYIKSRPNIINHPTTVLWGYNLSKSDAADDDRYKQISRDPWKMTGTIIKQARPLVAGIYRNPDGSWRQKTPASSRGAKKLWSDAVGLSRGGKRYNHPAAQDTARAIERQPELKLTYHFPEDDLLYSHTRKDVVAFLGALAQRSPNLLPRQAEALVMPGTHRDHLRYPTMRWTFERYAFAKT